MDTYQIYLYVVSGVLISVVLPILKKSLPTSKFTSFQIWWKEILPYLKVGAFSLLTGLLVVTIVGNNLNDWRAAILAGYAWDSTLQKLTI